MLPKILVACLEQEGDSWRLTELVLDELIYYGRFCQRGLIVDVASRKKTPRPGAGPNMEKDRASDKN